MKKISVVLFVISGLRCFSQSDYVESKPDRLLSISSIWLEGGFNLFSNPLVNISDFRKSAPESEILKADYSGFKSTEYFGMEGSGGVAFQAGWKLLSADKDKSNQRFELRTGLGFGRLSPWSLYLSQTVKTRIDTLEGGQTGVTLTLDSVSMQSLTANRDSRYIHLEFSALWRTNPAKELQAFTGLGVMGSLAYLSNIRIEHSLEKYAELKDVGGSTERLGTSTIDSSKEIFYLKSPMAYSLYIPVGVSYCLNRNAAEINKKWHITIEVRQGFTQIKYPGFDMRGSTFTALRWSLRYKI